jgi:uncharacterized damage-inducible protein DinB
MASTLTIRQAFSVWPLVNERLRAAVAAMSEDVLAIESAPGRWPLWATIGHTACQRVSWLCGFAGEPGAETTPFPNAIYNCPGDEDLEHVLSAAQLADALDSTFRIVERCLDTWTPESLSEVIRREFGADVMEYTRGATIQRVFAHDVHHCAEINEILGGAGLPQIELWDW